MSADGPLIQLGPSRAGTHRLINFDQCPQLYAYRHLLRLTPVVESPGRGLGTLIHLGLEHHYRRFIGLPAHDPFEAMRLAPARLTPFYERARRLLTGYLDWWGASDQRLDVLAVEHEVAITVGGHLHTQKFDLVVRMDDAAWVWDHKTSGAASVNVHAREWDFSRQFFSAPLVARATFQDLFGLPFGGVLINLLGTRTPHEFARHKLPHMQLEELVRVTESIRWTNDNINRLAGADPWQYPRTYACHGRYGACDYLPLCSAGKVARAEYVIAEDAATAIERDQ